MVQKIMLICAIQSVLYTAFIDDSNCASFQRADSRFTSTHIQRQEIPSSLPNVIKLLLFCIILPSLRSSVS